MHDQGSNPGPLHWEQGVLTTGSPGKSQFYVQFSSVTQLCLTVCDPMDCSTPGFPVHHQLPELAQSHVIKLVMPSNHLILCHPLLLLPSVFPSIRVFSSESVLHIRWPKYWSFSFSLSPFNDCSGLISFRIEWHDLLQSKGLSRVFSNTIAQKHQFYVICIFFPGIF